MHGLYSRTSSKGEGDWRAKAGPVDSRGRGRSQHLAESGSGRGSETTATSPFRGLACPRAHSTEPGRAWTRLREGVASWALVSRIQIVLSGLSRDSEQQRSDIGKDFLCIDFDNLVSTSGSSVSCSQRQCLGIVSQRQCLALVSTASVCKRRQHVLPYSSSSCPMDAVYTKSHSFTPPKTPPVPMLA